MTDQDQSESNAFSTPDSMRLVRSTAGVTGLLHILDEPHTRAPHRNVVGEGTWRIRGKGDSRRFTLCGAFLRRGSDSQGQLREVSCLRCVEEYERPLKMEQRREAFNEAARMLIHGTS